MGRERGVKHPIHHHLPLEGTIWLLLENTRLGRIRKVETKGREREGGKPGACSLDNAGSVLASFACIFFGHTQSLASRRPLSKTRCRCARLLPAGLHSSVCWQQKLMILGKTLICRPRAKMHLGEATPGIQPEVLLPAIDLP